MIKERKRLNEKYQRIQKSKDKNEKIVLYNQLLKEDNTNEEYILSYLLFIENYNNKDFENILKEKQIYISDINYKKYFKKYSNIRESARIKFINFINLIKDIELHKEDDKKNLLNKLYYMINTESEIKIIPTKEITWKNEELYLRNLYKYLIESMNKLIIKYFTKDKAIDNNQDIKYIVDNFDKIKDKIINGSFFNIYIWYFNTFLLNVDKNFKIRFKINNNEIDLSDMENKILFEEYIQFIASYSFCGKEDHLIAIWRETFVALNKAQKNKIFGNFEKALKLYIESKIKINDEYYYKYNDELNQFEIEHKIFKNNIIISNIDNYAFTPLIDSFMLKYNRDKIEMYKNKYLKITKYKDELFVSKTKNIWKNLLFQILNSNAYIEAKKSLFKCEQINFFDEESFLDEIIDNIKYFSYSTLYYGLTLQNTLSLYIRGIYDYESDKKQEILLLIFYGFHIVTTISEIGGNINIKLQYDYNLNNDFKDLYNISNISDNTKHDINNIKKKKKSAGEIIEIKLFGRIINVITIKECLFILNIDNYKYDVNNFRKNFSECHSKNIKDLLNTDLIDLLSKLGIKEKDIIYENGNRLYEMPDITIKNIDTVFYRDVPKHPSSFYYNADIKTISEIYALIQKEMKKANN